MSLPKALGLGLLGGVMAGLFGVGGGIVLVPGLVLLARMPQHRAHATSLVAILVTAPAALIPFASQDQVSWPAAAALASGALLGAVGGAEVMSRIPARRLQLLFGAFMLIVAVRLFLPGGGGEAAAAAIAITAATVIGLVLTGLATGLLSALLGVGGGVVMVPAMIIGFGFSQLLAQGTSLAVIIPTALVGAWRHARGGYTAWRTGFTVGAGGLVGGLLGGTVAQGLPADLLQAAFAGLLVVAGVRLIKGSRS
ncbi:MAG: sulfite exporter TauE/SafE family protein [Euzebya sp.]